MDFHSDVRLHTQIQFQVRYMVSWRDILGNSNQGKVSLHRGFAQRRKCSCSCETCVGRKIKIKGGGIDHRGGNKILNLLRTIHACI